MPKTSTKHDTEQVLDINSFIGGQNEGVPPTQIADNECEILKNFFLDRRGGKPRTRYPILKYSNSAVDPVAPISGMIFWKSTWFITAGQRIYYLDSSLDPVEIIGGLNGGDRPTFVPDNDKLIIGSGGVLQLITTTGCSQTW